MAIKLTSPDGQHWVLIFLDPDLKIAVGSWPYLAEETPNETWGYDLHNYENILRRIESCVEEGGSVSFVRDDTVDDLDGGPADLRKAN